MKNQANGSSSTSKTENNANNTRVRFDTPHDDFDFGKREDQGLLDLNLDGNMEIEGKGNRYVFHYITFVLVS